MHMSKDPKILAVLCKWCSYAGADLAGTSRFEYPSNIRIIQVPCSGRIDPLMIFKALIDGYDGILISGCHPGDCHYGTGNYFAQRRLAIARKLLETIGIDPKRLFFTWISAAEGKRFAEICADFHDHLLSLADSPKALAQEGIDR